MRPYGPGLTLWAYILIQFLHVTGIFVYQPHRHNSEARLEGGLLSTAVVLIASASLCAYYGDDPSSHERYLMRILCISIDVSILLCLYLAYTVIRENVAGVVNKDLLIVEMTRLNQAVDPRKPPKQDDDAEQPAAEDTQRRSLVEQTLKRSQSMMKTLMGMDDDYFANSDLEFYLTFQPDCFLKWAKTADPGDPKTKLVLDDIKHINEHLLEAYCCDDGEMGTYSVSREADVWQQLVGAFPNIFEWLMTDPTDSEIAHFKGLVETLTKLRAHFNYGAPDVDPDWTYTAHGRAQLKAHYASALTAMACREQQEDATVEPFMRLIHKEDRATLVYALCTVDHDVRTRFLRIIASVRAGQDLDPLEIRRAEKHIEASLTPDYACDAGPPDHVKLKEEAKSEFASVKSDEIELVAHHHHDPDQPPPAPPLVNFALFCAEYAEPSPPDRVRDLPRPGNDDFNCLFCDTHNEPRSKDPNGDPEAAARASAFPERRSSKSKRPSTRRKSRKSNKAVTPGHGTA